MGLGVKGRDHYTCKLEKGEFIKDVLFLSSKFIDGLKILTSDGRSLGPYGEDGDSDFTRCNASTDWIIKEGYKSLCGFSGELVCAAGQMEIANFTLVFRCVETHLTQYNLATTDPAAIGQVDCYYWKAGGWRDREDWTPTDEEDSASNDEDW